MENEVKVTDPTMSINGINPPIDAEAHIYGYQNWNSMDQKGYEREVAEGQKKLDFLHTINAKGAKIANKTAYEIVRNAALADYSKRISLTALSARIERINSTDIELVRKQRCIKFYQIEILPLRRDLDEFREQYSQIQKEISQKYAAFQRAEGANRQEIESKGKELAKKSKELERKIATTKERLEEKRKRLIAMQRTDDIAIKESFNDKLNEIRAQLKVKPQDSVLSKIRPDIPFEKIDDIASIVSEYSELEARKRAITLDLSNEETEGILHNPILESVKDCFGKYIVEDQIKDVKVTESLADNLSEKSQKYGHAYGKVLFNLMGRELLDVFYSPYSDVQAKKYDPNSEEFEKMYLLYKLLCDETIDKDSEIEELMAELDHLRNSIFSNLQKPEFVRRTVCKGSIQKDESAYKATTDKLDKKFRQFMNDFLVTLGVPALDEWISSLEVGIIDHGLRSKIMEQAKMKYDFLGGLSHRVIHIYGSKVVPLERKQIEKKKELFREIGVPEDYILYEKDEYKVPIIENYEDRAEVLRTIAAAQQTPEIDEKEIRQTVIKQANDTTEDIKHAMGRIDEDYNKTVQFSNMPRL